MLYNGLERAMFLEDGALPVGAVLALGDLQNAVELGFAPEVLRDGAQPLHEIKRPLPGGGVVSGREVVEPGFEAVADRAPLVLCGEQRVLRRVLVGGSHYALDERGQRGGAV